MTDLKPYIADVIDAAKADDKTSLQQACKSLKKQLPAQPGPIRAEDAVDVLETLRSTRNFEETHSMAEAFILDGCTDPAVERQLGQALIEEGSLPSAVGVLEGLAARLNSDRDHPEFAEAKGLLGRSWKQIFVDTDEKRSELRDSAIDKAVSFYREGYNLNRKKNYWHGINLAAVLSMGDRYKANKDWSSEAQNLAKEVLETVKAIPDSERKYWDTATAAEAAVALGKMGDAAEWLHHYVDDKEVDAFELGSTLRQLTEVWGLSLEGRGADLLAPLEARLLRLPGGKVKLSPNELQKMSEVPKESYQRVLGPDGPQTHTWMQKFNSRALSVALIRHNDRGIGTGFVISGKHVGDDYANELFVVTNSHVVSDPPQEKAVRPEEATVTFELKNQKSGNRIEYEIDEIVWSSPPEEHDATILRLQPSLKEDAVAPMPIAKNLPTLSKDPPQRVYIIGHPDGGEISYSLNDNVLIDHEHLDGAAQPITRPIKVQYRAPTEPGSSGSPVFNASLRLVAVHHAGGISMPRLNGQPGTHPANEGLWIQSILNASRT